MLKISIKILLIIVLSYSLHSCANRGDARNFHLSLKKNKKNLEEVRIWISDAFGNKGGGSGNFEFAGSNALWRASLDTIDFIPLASANYSGGIIITDWYSSGSNMDESIKLSIRFLTNEVRSDALDIKIFYKKCGQNESCQISEKKGSLITELNKKILAKAAIYQEQSKDKNFKPYKGKMKSLK